MNTVSRFKTGNRKLLTSLNRKWNRKLGASSTSRVGPARRPDDLAVALSELTQVIRLHRRWIKEMPEYFDPVLVAQRQREQERERWLNEEVRPALDRVYSIPILQSKLDHECKI